MSSLIDSHCHLHTLDLENFDNNLDNVMKQGRDAGVKEMLCVCIEYDDIPKIQKIAEQYENIYTSVGLHPNVRVDRELDCDEIVALTNHSSCIAIGETGLDYFRIEHEDEKLLQQGRFREHIKAALVSQKPLIIHTRMAPVDTINILKEENARDIGGVMHCFTESYEVAKKALDLNFYISISGIVTFKNAATIIDVATKVPLDRLLIETDSPYLAPVPYRGKPNHPALVKYVAEKIAELKNVPFSQVCAQTTENFYKCFNLKSKQG